MLSSFLARITTGSILRSRPLGISPDLFISQTLHPELLSITQFSPLDRSNRQIRWATKKAGGTVKNSKDSKPKYLGIKKFGGEWCKPGNIILRQRGQKYRPGEYVGMGRDFTIWALVEGQVKFWEKRVESERTGEKRKKTGVSIIPGVQPEKKRKPLLPWFDSVIRRRRREKKLKFEPIKKQNRLFQYTWPNINIVAEVTMT